MGYFMKKGKLIVISGISGSGKSTIYKAMVEKFNNYTVSVSKTTRAPRDYEVEGVDYFFCSKEQFEKDIKEGAFLEYAQYVNNYYGTPKSYTLEQLENGKDVILEIEVQGALQVKEKYPDAILVFVSAPSFEETIKRLSNRGTESEEVIQERIKRGIEEFEYRNCYDIVLVNDEVDKCVERLHGYIQNLNFIKEI